VASMEQRQQQVVQWQQLGWTRTSSLISTGLFYYGRRDINNEFNAKNANSNNSHKEDLVMCVVGWISWMCTCMRCFSFWGRCVLRTRYGESIFAFIRVSVGLSVLAKKMSI